MTTPTDVALHDDDDTITLRTKGNRATHIEIGTRQIAGKPHHWARRAVSGRLVLMRGEDPREMGALEFLGRALEKRAPR